LSVDLRECGEAGSALALVRLAPVEFAQFGDDDVEDLLREPGHIHGWLVSMR